MSCASQVEPSAALDLSPAVSLLVSEFAEEPPALVARLRPLLKMRARVEGDGDVDGPETSVNKLDMPTRISVARVGLYC